MTRDDIVRMALEAGFSKDTSGLYHSCGGSAADSDLTPPLERFVELVAAAERERLNKKIAALESDVDHFFKLSGEYLERANKAEEAVALERERCAKVCDAIHADAEDSIAQTNTSIWVAAFMGRSMAARDCAAAIRRMR